MITLVLVLRHSIENRSKSRSKFVRFEERFQNAPFSRGLTGEVKPAPFLNFSSVVLTESEKIIHYRFSIRGVLRFFHLRLIASFGVS